MFRLEPWIAGQNCASRRFSLTANSRPQDFKQVWFAGVHADVGGGYPEKESGISKYPLLWMIEEAKKFGLQFDQATIDHLVWGVPRMGSPFTYCEPNTSELPHDSVLGVWRTLEYFPKSDKYKEWTNRLSFLGHYLPLKEPRSIADGVTISQSADELRKKVSKYRPINYPKKFDLWPLPKKAKSRSREVTIAP